MLEHGAVVTVRLATGEERVVMVTHKHFDAGEIVYTGREVHGPRPASMRFREADVASVQSDTGQPSEEA